MKYCAIRIKCNCICATGLPQFLLLKDGIQAAAMAAGISVCNDICLLFPDILYMEQKTMDWKENQHNTASRRKYILFVCHHLSSLYQFVLLRLTRYKKHQVVLLVYNALFCQSSFAKNLEKRRVFDRILAIREPKNFEEKQYERFVTDYYDDYFVKNGLCFENIEEIYSACDLNNLFPVYCTLNHRAISYLEMYEGQFQDKDRYRFCTAVFGYPPWIEELYRKYHTLSGDGGADTAKRYLWPGSIREYPEKDVNTDFLKGFYALSDDKKKLIADCVGLPEEIDVHEMNLLLLNSPRWTKAITGLEPPFHYLPYLLIADYYFDRTNFFLKNHPHAEADPYFINEISVRANVMPATVPIEFYGLIDRFRVKKLISVASSGNAKIADFIAEETDLTENYLREYQYIHKCYLTLSLAHGLEERFICHGVGITDDFIRKLDRCAFASEQREAATPDSCTGADRIYQLVGKGAVSGNDAALSLFEENRITVFLDPEAALDSLTKIQRRGFAEQLIGIEIHKIAIYEHTLSNTQTEYLFLFCTDKEYICRIRGSVWDYTLYHTGIRITAKMLEHSGLSSHLNGCA